MHQPLEIYVDKKLFQKNFLTEKLVLQPAKKENFLCSSNNIQLFQLHFAAFFLQSLCIVLTCFLCRHIIILPHFLSPFLSRWWQFFLDQYLLCLAFPKYHREFFQSIDSMQIARRFVIFQLFSFHPILQFL